MVFGTTRGQGWTETLPANGGANFTGRTFFRLHLLGEGLPTIAEIWATRDHRVEGHAHAADELLYVLGGAIEVNGRRLERNEVEFIPAGTKYTARVASDGGSHVLRVEFPHGSDHDGPPEYDARPWPGPLTNEGFPDLSRE
jgi:hypothetical protein